MTIAADNTKNIANGNDVATVFNFTFKINFSTDLVVVRTDASNVEYVLTEGVDYSVTGVGSDTGGSITYPLSGSPLPTGEKLTMYRVPAIKQLTDLINQGGYYPQTVENALDLLTMIAQMLNEALGRAIKLDVSDESGADITLPTPVASTVIGWNSLADALQNISPGSVSLALPASDSIVADMINVAGTQATLGRLTSGNYINAGSPIQSIFSIGSWIKLDPENNQLIIKNAAPRLKLYESGVAANSGIWELFADGTSLYVRVLSDDELTIANAIKMDRTTTSVDLIDFLSTNLRHNGVAVPTISSADALSNKDMVDNSCSFVDSADYTKKLAFECAGITTGTKRTITFPNADTTFNFQSQFSSTGTNVANIASFTAVLITYQRQGSVVVGCLDAVVVTTAAATYSQFRATLPIASNFTIPFDAQGGGAIRDSTTLGPAMIESDFTNDQLLCSFTSIGAGTAHNVRLPFTYVIK